MLNVVLQMTHKHEVTSLVPAAVQRVVIDVAQNSACADAVGAVLGVDELAQAIHEDGAVLPFALFLVLLRLRWKWSFSYEPNAKNCQQLLMKIKIGAFCTSPLAL